MTKTSDRHDLEADDFKFNQLFLSQSYILFYGCLYNMAPRYLTEMFMPIGMSARRQDLPSATISDLVIPRVRLATCSRAFIVAGPVCWKLERLTKLPQVAESVI